MSDNPWYGNILIFKWSQQKGMMDMRLSDVPYLRKLFDK